MSFKQLTWGVKASFCGYVEGVGGSIALSDGASRTAEGAFVFTAVPGGDLSIASDGSASGAMHFQGTVSFEAHGGMLKSTLTELGIEADDDGLVLTALDTQMNRGRCPIAKLELVQAGDDGATILRSEITIEGMLQIADNYPPGTELDPVHLD